ncbi:McrC family protein [Massilia mucilaginosa]|nr:McrC family protein [Massilia mucilaginosa]
MHNERLLIENGDWQPWDAGFSAGRGDPDRLRQSLEGLGKKFRKQLGLRADPFAFRSGMGGAVEVRTSGIAGTVSVGDLVLDIAPKFVPRGDGLGDWSASMLLLMQHARKRDLALNRARHLAVERHSFVDLLAMAFSDATEAGLADQAIHTYKTSPQCLPVLRGRMNLPRQIRSVFARPHLLECDVDELDADNGYNGLLKWAALAFAAAVRAPTLRRRLSDLALRLPGKPSRRIALQGGRLQPPPQFRVWTEALEIAALLSSGLSHATGRGVAQGYSFVFNMERLFEHFIELSLARAVAILNKQGFSARTQVSIAYAEPDPGSSIRFFSRPDNLVLRHGVPAVVVDAKYKRLSDAEGMRNRKPVNADVYELVAAMTAHNCRCGLLVYPRVLGDAVLNDHELHTWTVSSFGTTLRVGALALDLSALRVHADLQHIDTTLTAALESLLAA